VANQKIIEVEEDLYQSKSIQLELLNNLKTAESRYEETVTTQETLVSQVEERFRSTIEFQKGKIQELDQLVQKMEFT
jgi:hypothetical protein